MEHENISNAGHEDSNRHILQQQRHTLFLREMVELV